MSLQSTKNQKPNRSQAAIVGVGAVGQHLGRALHQASYPVDVLIDIDLEKAQNLAKVIHTQKTGSLVSEIPDNTRVIFLTVPDDKIVAAATELAGLQFLNQTHTVIHCSGALPANIMAPLSDRGVQLLSFHPIASFTQELQDDLFRGIYIGVEGDEDALALGNQIAEDIGAIPIQIPTELKTTYHLSAVWASNFLVGLLDQAITLMENIGYDRETSWNILKPLVKGTIDGINSSGIEGALTGPAHRGDVGTIQRHLEHLNIEHPEMVTPYREWTKTLITRLVAQQNPGHKQILNLIQAP